MGWTRNPLGFARARSNRVRSGFTFCLSFLLDDSLSRVSALELVLRDGKYTCCTSGVVRRVSSLCLRPPAYVSTFLCV